MLIVFSGLRLEEINFCLPSVKMKDIRISMNLVSVRTTIWRSMIQRSDVHPRAALF